MRYQTIEKIFPALGTLNSVTIRCPENQAENSAKILRDVRTMVLQLDDQLSLYKESAELSAVNRSSGIRFCSVSSDTYRIFKASSAFSEITDGAFDITAGGLSLLWKKSLRENRIPGFFERMTARRRTGFRNLLFSEDAAASSFRVFLKKPGMIADLGGIAKGYAADQALLILEKNGITSALLDFGGNIQTLGRKPDGSLWRVGIKNPWTGGAACALSLESKAVVTSGGYERFFEDESGNRYIHIFDPSTGRPCDGELESVTIISSSGKYADALSTALFVMGKDSAIEWWKNNPDFDFILLTKNKELIYSSGIKDFIEPLFQFEKILVIQN